MNSAEEIRAGMILNLIEGLGPIRLHQLIQVFGSAFAACGAGAGEWAAHIGDISFCEKVAAEIPRLSAQTDREIEQCDKLGIKILSLTIGPYPSLLKEIRVPPVILYVKGQAAWEQMDGIAV